MAIKGGCLCGKVRYKITGQLFNKIAEYIALDKQTAAKQLTRTVFAAVDRLTEFPKMGRKVP